MRPSAKTDRSHAVILPGGPPHRPGLIRVALRADAPDSQDDRSVGLANYSRLIEQAGRGAPHAAAASAKKTSAIPSQR